MVDNGRDVLLGGNTCLSDEERARLDEGDDADFYAEPRIGVHHTDTNFTAALTALYARLLRPRTAILDLCSSWASHLPADMPLASVIGIGMNAEELAANPQLTARVVHDLNRQPRLPGVHTGSLATVTCVNGLQYLTHPEWVLAEAFRALRPGGRVIAAFSRHCWESKATSAWLQRPYPGTRLQLLGRLLEHAGFESVHFVCWDAHTAAAASCDARAQHGDSTPPTDVITLAALLKLTDKVPAHLLPAQPPELPAPSPGTTPVAGPQAFGSVAFVTRAPSEADLRPAAPAPTEGSSAPGPLHAQLAGLQLRTKQSKQVGAGDPTAVAGPAGLGAESWDPLYAITAVKPAIGQQAAGETGWPAAAVDAPGVPDEQHGTGGAQSSPAPAAGRAGLRVGSGSTQSTGAPPPQRSPAEVAADFVAPALLEIEVIRADGGEPPVLSNIPNTSTTTVQPETLERWRSAYAAMCNDARSLGIPASALPPLAPDASPAEIRNARDHLQGMMASFLSAGL